MTKDRWDSSGLFVECEGACTAEPTFPMCCAHENRSDMDDDGENNYYIRTDPSGTFWTRVFFAGPQKKIKYSFFIFLNLFVLLNFEFLLVFQWDFVGMFKFRCL